jgi:hypothetical protein
MNDKGICFFWSDVSIREMVRGFPEDDLSLIWTIFRNVAGLYDKVYLIYVI